MSFSDFVNFLGIMGSVITHCFDWLSSIFIGGLSMFQWYCVIFAVVLFVVILRRIAFGEGDTK